VGCIWPLADYQAKLACLEILGRYRRPDDLKGAIQYEIEHPHFNFEGGQRIGCRGGRGSTAKAIANSRGMHRLWPRAVSDRHATFLDVATRETLWKPTDARIGDGQT
jgi:hypothetical protein